MFDSLDVSVSGLVAHRVWMDTIQANMANLNNTRDTVDAEGRPVPYKRRVPVFGAGSPNGATVGVRVVSIEQDDRVDMVRDPGHPDAIQSGPEAGMVRKPAISWSVEMVNAMIAQRAYEANMTALNVTKQMYVSDLRILG